LKDQLYADFICFGYSKLMISHWLMSVPVILDYQYLWRQELLLRFGPVAMAQW
jgi:hypothetical protein